MHKVYRYRLYPTKAQETIMNQTLELCRFVYNQTLAIRKDAWEQEQKSISNYDTHNLLPSWKAQHLELKTVHSQVLQETQQRVDLAFKAFFRRVKAGEKEVGYPRFKGKGRYDSFTYPQLGFSLKETTLKLSKIGDVKIKLHRAIEGTVKRLNINRRSSGKWFACFTTEYEPKTQPFKDGAVVGIDVGLTSFATLSNGEKVENPRFFRHDEKALAKAQRKLSAQEKGTPKRAKARKVVSRIHERIGSRRNDFVHQLSRAIVNRFGIVAFEDLNVKGMVQNRYLAKSIGDAAWTQFINATQNKAEEAGSIVVLVNPNNTTQECSRCGQIVKKELKDRKHSCDCGYVADRDENAAINILRRGLTSVGVKTIEAACES
jgi:putative transposase